MRSQKKDKRQIEEVAKGAGSDSEGGHKEGRVVPKRTEGSLNGNRITGVERKLGNKMQKRKADLSWTFNYKPVSLKLFPS